MPPRPPDVDLLELFRPHLKASLPDYMVPALIVALPALPLTPNAKVDRAALPAPDWGLRASGAERVEPRNPVEETLARIWGELLATPTSVGVTDNLFDDRRPFADRDPVRGPGGRQLRGEPAGAPDLRPSRPSPSWPRSCRPIRTSATDSTAESELDELSDDELDELLRAALAQRNRRRAAPGATDA